MSRQNWLRGRTIVYNAPPKLPPKPKRFRIGRILWSAIKKTATVIGMIMLISAAISVLASVVGDREKVPVIPDNIVLTLNLAGSFPESSGSSQYLSLLKLKDEPLTLSSVIDAIDQAAKDKRVKALAFKASSSGYDVSQLQEIRAAVQRFKKTGKKTVIYSESYGGSGYGLGLYYLASVFDEIWMQPVGVVTIGGISAEMPFFKGVMDQYGVEGQFFQRKEYKNAMEHLTADHMSLKSRESIQGMIDNMAAQLVGPIKRDRPKVASAFDSLLQRGLITDKEALSSGLIDQLNYEDILLDTLEKSYKNAGLMSVKTYAGLRSRDNYQQNIIGSKHTTVAIIHIDGMIVSGSGASSPYGMGGEVIGADDLAEAIHDAASDSRVKAIVLRVNSPGGSPSASETIGRAVDAAIQKSHKPVYVSMGTVAASGGYWISATATKIYAMPATLTGSIGVVGGKVNLQKLWEKYHVNWDRVSVGQNSSMFSMNTPFTASEQKEFEASLDSVYDSFIARVAKGRNLTPAQTEVIAKGHVWTGEQAKTLGLVDKIGGLNDVLDQIAKDNKLKSRYDLTLVHLPNTEKPMDVLLELLGAQSSQMPDVLRQASSRLALIEAQLSSPRMVLDSSIPDGRW